MNSIKPGRFLILILLLNLITQISSGQAALLVLILGDRVATENFYLSIDGGINLASFPGIDGSKLGAGVDFGLGTHIKLGEKWYLKPEFKPLAHKKANSVDPISAIPPDLSVDKTRLTLNYIDVPVFLQYYISPKVFISAGPQVSFLTSVSQISTGKLEDGRESTIKIETQSLFNTVNFSFPVEMGFTYKLVNKKSLSTRDIQIFLRYEYDFLEIFKDPETGSTLLSMFQLGLSLPFIKSPEELAKSKKAKSENK